MSNRFPEYSLHWLSIQIVPPLARSIGSAKHKPSNVLKTLWEKITLGYFCFWSFLISKYISCTLHILNVVVNSSRANQFFPRLDLFKLILHIPSRPNHFISDKKPLRVPRWLKENMSFTRFCRSYSPTVLSVGYKRVIQF